MEVTLKLAVIGGTGDLGSGLAKRWADAGHSVVVGSRSREKAVEYAREASANLKGELTGDDNVSAARGAEVVVIAVPYASHDATLRELHEAVQGKIVVDAVVPLVPPKVSVVQLPKEGSAAQQASAILGESVKVVSAFHNIGASKLHAGVPTGCDVLVFGDDKSAKDTVIALANQVGARGVDGGALANSAAAEALTSVLIGINRRYKVDGAGISITGLALSV